jgi:pimeloyl-ACP methyl ester carboxylesterase
MLAAMDERENLDRITSPTLVIGGEDDSLLPPIDMQEIASRIPTSQFMELPTGHFAAVNTPIIWANEALRFFDSE